MRREGPQALADRARLLASVGCPTADSDNTEPPCKRARGDMDVHEPIQLGSSEQ